MKALERELEQGQQALAGMEQQLAAADLYQEGSKDELQAILRQQGELQARLEQQEEQWLALQEQLEALQD